MNKLVDLDKLDEFRLLIQTASRSEILKYFDEKIYELEKIEINQLKKIIYGLMTAWKDKDQDRSRYYYCIYNNLKNGRIDRKTAILNMNSYEKK
jgi:hypothetical protein